MRIGNISGKLYLALATVITGFLLYSLYLYGTLNLLKVNGPIYKQIVTGKDLIADILPPPDYIIESYLMAYELRENMGQDAQVDLLSDRLLNKLKTEYDTRHVYWVEDGMFLPQLGSIKDVMLEASHAPVVRFYDLMEKEYLPAIRSKNKDSADSILNNKLKPLYEEHRKQIDLVVEASTEKNAEMEKYAVVKERRNFLASLLLFLVCAGASIVLMMALARTIVRPIRLTVDMLRDISEGEGDLTKRLEIKGKNEIGEMAAYFNQTLEKVKHLVMAIRFQSETLSDIGKDLSANMNETAASVHQISSNIQSIKSQTMNQSASVTETNSTMSQITQNIERLNTHIDQQATSVTQSSSAIEEMMANIAAITQNLAKNTTNAKELTEASEQGRSDMGAVTEKLREVARDSEGLIEISGVIGDIASQTNLLSMNAAIEAAHAGDSGRGFAVVADEIRKLAESSAAQSKTIATVLNRIKSSVDTISSAADAVLGQFEDIDGKLKTLSERQTQIRNAMDEQSAGSKEILQAISQLNEITTQVKTGSDEMLSGSREVIRESKNLEIISSEVNSSMNEMSSGVQHITTAINKVNDMSKQNKDSIEALMAEVGRFKVG